MAGKINAALSKFFIETYNLPEAPTSLGLKRVLSDFLLIAKKNYATKYFWDEKKGYKEDWDFKGLEIIRSDSSNIEKNVLEKMVKAILDHNYAQLPLLEKEIKEQLRSKSLDPIEVAYPLQLKKQFKDYVRINKKGRKIIASHAKAAIYSNMYLNTDYERGDKPRRLPIVPEKKKKIAGMQTGLFGEKVYPTSFEFQGGRFSMNGVSITEDIEVPAWFLNRIDWTHITERLSGKIKKIRELSR